MEKPPIFVPCTRGFVPALRPLYDLSLNVESAMSVLQVLDPFFYFTDNPEIGLCVFSGSVRRADEYDGTRPLLYVQVWRGTRLYRSFAFRSVGYVGVVDIACPPEGLGFTRDYLESIFAEFSENCHLLPEGADRQCLVLVEGNQLTLSLPWIG